jgi:hypothetical protein
VHNYSQTARHGPSARSFLNILRFITDEDKRQNDDQKHNKRPEDANDGCNDQTWKPTETDAKKKTIGGNAINPAPNENNEKGNRVTN